MFGSGISDSFDSVGVVAASFDYTRVAVWMSSSRRMNIR
jgi:hypothetical protein